MQLVSSSRKPVEEFGNHRVLYVDAARIPFFAIFSAMRCLSSSSLISFGSRILDDLPHKFGKLPVVYHHEPGVAIERRAVLERSVHV